ncbi:hypothetical protein QAD02_006810 [Eretmocerus hayati]|uniref:Uncharacterized protein n=1 Tax=Eretmocerus hayati TaxID=131215 RepID=A0ACC2N329_9HYME|nr:hypothetical protein QAD02_006810 [Eretmocerus hayati]
MAINEIRVKRASRAGISQGRQFMLSKPKLMNDFPRGHYSAHENIQFCNFTLTTKSPDNCCYLKDGTIVEIKHNRKNSEGVSVIKGKKFLDCRPLDNYMMESRQLDNMQLNASTPDNADICYNFRKFDHLDSKLLEQNYSHEGFQLEHENMNLSHCDTIVIEPHNQDFDPGFSVNNAINAASEGDVSSDFGLAACSGKISELVKRSMGLQASDSVKRMMRGSISSTAAVSLKRCSKVNFPRKKKLTNPEIGAVIQEWPRRASNRLSDEDDGDSDSERRDNDEEEKTEDEEEGEREDGKGEDDSTREQ